MADDSVRDDAPPATAKSGDAAAQFAQELPEAKGDQVVARSVTINRPSASCSPSSAISPTCRVSWRMSSASTSSTKSESHWVVKAPGGTTVEWTARITDEAPNSVIAWASEEGADVPNSGHVTFRDAGARGTVVSATILYEPPAGFIGKIIRQDVPARNPRSRRAATCAGSSS